MNCSSCGKELLEAKEIARRNERGPNIPIEAWIVGMASDTLDFKCVCLNCASAFCVECGQNEGRKQNSNDVYCPHCGKQVMPKDEVFKKVRGK